MKVKDIMSSKVSFVEPSAKITDIAMMMSQQDYWLSACGQQRQCHRYCY
jgi:predicted transcriptional regulator